MAQAREVQLPLDVEGLLEMTRETLSSFAVEMGWPELARPLRRGSSGLCRDVSSTSNTSRTDSSRFSVAARDGLISGQGLGTACSPCYHLHGRVVHSSNPAAANAARRQLAGSGTVAAKLLATATPVPPGVPKRVFHVS